MQKRKSLTMSINSILQHKKGKSQITQKRKQLGQHIYSVFSRNSFGITIVINLGLVMLILLVKVFTIDGFLQSRSS